MENLGDKAVSDAGLVGKEEDGLKFVRRKAIVSYKRVFGTALRLDKTKSAADAENLARNDGITSVSDAAGAIVNLLDVTHTDIGNAAADGKSRIAIANESAGKRQVGDGKLALGTVAACVGNDED